MTQDIQTILDAANALLRRMGGQKPAVDLNEALARIVSHHPDLIQGGVKIVGRLINAEADVNIVDHYDRTPLHNAVRHHDLGTVRLLLQNGANVHACDCWGQTPLRAALFQLQWDPVDLQILKALIAAGSDLNKSCMRGDSPLIVAVRNHETEVVRILVQGGADVTAANPNGEGLLHLLVKIGGTSSVSAGIVRILVKAGADVNGADKDGNTPLHLALLTRENM
jgi:ankyrin repeat protein